MRLTPIEAPATVLLRLAYAVSRRQFGRVTPLDDTVFSERERAALAFVEEATRHRALSEPTWSAVRERFNETEIVEITWLNAAENSFNLQAAVLGIGSDRLAVTTSSS